MTGIQLPHPNNGGGHLPGLNQISLSLLNGSNSGADKGEEPVFQPFNNTSYQGKK